ncbi:MAG: FHA domain-containing protein [Thioalkalispiraceae bacterium]
MAALIQYVNGVPAIKFSLDELSTYIGRASASDICIDDKYVSKQHALIEVASRQQATEQQAFYIRDLDSTNHTYVNEVPVKRARLKNRDSIRIGEEYFVFEQEEGEEEIAELKAFPGQEQQVSALTSELQDAPKLNKRFSRRLKLF